MEGQEERQEHAAVSRLKSENLTPQWSIESQVSQDSSDDVLLTSESDNRSNIISRSSTVSQSPSRPASTHDSNEPKTNEAGEAAPRDETNSEIYQDGKIQKSMEKLSLNAQFENKEIVSPETHENTPTPPRHKPPTPKDDLRQSLKEPTPPPPRSVPLSSDPGKNPYKRTTVLSHSAANKRLPKEPTDPFNAQLVNLETVPDNSERPDLVENAPKAPRKTSVQQQWVAENLEVAPINDRNQYLETGQLSESDGYNNQGSGDNVDSLPPPGLRRVVPGQLEQVGSAVDNNDEPPPGLSRMVLGRTETDPNNLTGASGNGEPPVGLHRMVPGESSSPESSPYPR